MPDSHRDRLLIDRARIIEHLGTLRAGDLTRLLWLNNLGNLSLALYDCTGELEHLQAAVDWHTAAWTQSPGDDPGRAGFAANLATSHLQRFRARGDSSDLAAAREHIESALAITPSGHEQLPGRLHTLGNVLEVMFRRHADPEVLEEATRARRRTLEAVPEGARGRSILLTGAGNTAKLRYETHLDIADLDAALAFHEQALAEAPSDAVRAAARSNLSNCYADRFQISGVQTDLAAALDLAEGALALTAKDHPERAGRASNLASMLRARYDHEGDPADLDRAIALTEGALAGHPAGSPGRPALLGNLGAALHTRFRHRGSGADLETAAGLLREAVTASGVSKAELPRWKNNLGNVLSSLFLRTSDMRDLDEAIDSLRGAVALTPGAHPQRAARLHNLAGSLHRRVAYRGSVADLNEAITCYSAAAQAAPAGRRLASAANAGLGATLGLRFALQGDGEDLDAAVRRLRLALRFVGDLDPDRPTWLVNLADQLIRRFQHTQDRDALDEAIEVLAQATRATEPGHPFQSLRLETHGRALAMRFEAFADLADADAAVRRCEQAADAALDPVDRGTALHVLGDVLQARYVYAAGPEDLNRAGAALREAARILPATHPDHPIARRSLALWVRFCAALNHDRHAADQAVDLLESLARRTSRPGRPDPVTLMELATAYRVRSELPGDPLRGREDRSLSRRTGQEALQACAEEVLLQPGTADGLAVARRTARRGSAVISWCLLDDEVAEAVEVIESARGLVHRAAMFTGSTGRRLRAAGHDDLATRWEAEQALAIQSRGTMVGATAVAPPDAPIMPSRLRGEVISVLAGRGLETAFSPDALSATLAETRTDALVHLLPGTAERPGYAVLTPARGPSRRLILDDFHAVPGGHLSVFVDAYNRLLVAAAREMRGPDDEDPHRERRRLTEAWIATLHALCDWAWEAVMAPVLTAVGDLSPACDGAPPRLVLVPVGHAALVPWHAARTPTDEGGHHHAVEEAVISYAASAELFCETARRGRLSMDGRALIVGNPTFNLRYAEAEARQILRRCYPSGQFIGPPRAGEQLHVTAEDLTSQLSGEAAFPVIHLASHGYAAADPARSRLALTGGRSLTIEQLLAHGRGIGDRSAGPLVVLSACASGMSNDDFDEMMTLTTAFLIAGASAAVGSLWIVDDRTTADLMTTFHELLTSDLPDPADALRAAQIEMIRAGRQTSPVPGRRSPGDPYCWAAFTHQGN
ncbi:CHAT domain-containing tetratricopeptide repeat protein [Herbidospora daliensis]|uniref:CHAT domain-containing tetratricopeptide repeat protein n=1 Tax=Herbidospora daliensis TaxID=295585 RepID=UPI000782CB16|nr:CHAT domain-containing protein [Herbidospora daliensis]